MRTVYGSVYHILCIKRKLINIEFWLDSYQREYLTPWHHKHNYSTIDVSRIGH